MAARLLDPLDVLGVRLDIAGRYSRRRVLKAFGGIDIDKTGLALDLAETAALYEEEPPSGEVDGTEEEPPEGSSLMDSLVDTIIDTLLDAQLEALDAAGEYTSTLVAPRALIGGPGAGVLPQPVPALLAKPAVPSAEPFLGRIGSQTVQQYVEITPRAVAARIAGGATPTEAMTAAGEFLAEQGVAEPHIMGRDAVATVAINDPRFMGYARVARADACDFCKMLASRGPVYSTDTALVTREGQPYHSRRANGSGGACKCRMVAMPREVAGIQRQDDWRELRPGDKTAVAGAYKPGAKTPQRAGAVDRQLTLLRETVANGTASDWTRRRIAELEAEKAGLLFMPRAAFPAGNVSLRYDPNQPRVPAGQHGGGRFGSKAGALPAGWTMDTLADQGRVLARHPERGLSVTAKPSDFIGPLHGDISGASARAQAAVTQTAAKLAELDAINPAPHGVDVTIVHPADMGKAGGRVHWGNDLATTARMEINSNLWATAPNANRTWITAFEKNQNVGLPDDLVGSIVTHEYGHVLQRGAAERIPEWRAPEPARAVGLHSGESWRMATARAGGTEEQWAQLTDYAKSHPVEAYAEAFAEWSLRDRRPMSSMSHELARREGWK